MEARSGARSGGEAPGGSGAAVAGPAQYNRPYGETSSSGGTTLTEQANLIAPWAVPVSQLLSSLQCDCSRSRARPIANGPR